eukprot:39699-Chlamydomonas_euryale.AAC.6
MASAPAWPVAVWFVEGVDASGGGSCSPWGVPVCATGVQRPAVGGWVATDLEGCGVRPRWRPRTHTEPTGQAQNTNREMGGRGAQGRGGRA